MYFEPAYIEITGSGEVGTLFVNTNVWSTSLGVADGQSAGRLIGPLNP